MKFARRMLCIYLERERVINDLWEQYSVREFYMPKRKSILFIQHRVGSVTYVSGTSQHITPY